MNAREQLIAYIATLLTLLVVVMGSLIIASIVPEMIGKIEAFGIGTVTGGLIGVLRIPSLRSPVATTEAGDVNVGAPPEKPDAAPDTPESPDWPYGVSKP